jgi:hypothetical protein
LLHCLISNTAAVALLLAAGEEVAMRKRLWQHEERFGSNRENLVLKLFLSRVKGKRCDFNMQDYNEIVVVNNLGVM